MADLMARVGYFLLHWGYLEAALRESVERFSPGLPAHRAPGRSVVNRWALAQRCLLEQDDRLNVAIHELENEMEEVRAVRNLIAHGMSAASADPQLGHPPCVTCRDENGRHRTVDLPQLEDEIRKLERLTLAVRRGPM